MDQTRWHLNNEISKRREELSPKIKAQRDEVAEMLSGSPEKLDPSKLIEILLVYNDISQVYSLVKFFDKFSIGERIQPETLLQDHKGLLMLYQKALEREISKYGKEGTHNLD